MNETEIVSAPSETRVDGTTHCHVFIEGAQVSYCGVPRDEQPLHGKDGRAPGTGASVTPFCPYCGLPRCPTCARLSVERGRRWWEWAA